MVPKGGFHFEKVGVIITTIYEVWAADFRALSAPHTHPFAVICIVIKNHYHSCSELLLQESFLILKKLCCFIYR